MKIRELITILGFKVDEASIKNADAKTALVKKRLVSLSKWVGASVLAIGTFAIKAAADMEMLTTQFEVMLGSTEKAKALMEDLKKFAAATPFQLEDLAQGTQVLLSFGIGQERVIETMRMLGDTAGGNREKLSSLILAYGKVQTKGRASMEEINMMAERGIPIIDVLQKQLGVTKEQFFKLVAAGKIGKEDVTRAFQSMTSEGGLFYKGMEKASLTFSGLLSTLKDNLSLMLASVGEKLLPFAKQMIETLTKLVQGPLGDVINSLVTVLTPVLEMLGPIFEVVLQAIQPIVNLLGTLFAILSPIIKLLLEMLQPVIKILEIVLGWVAKLIGLLQILEPVIQLLSIFLEVFLVIMEALDPILSTIFEIFVMWSEIITDLLKLLMPFVRIFLLLASKVLTAPLKLLVPVLKIIASLLKVIFGLLRPIINLLTKILLPVFEKIASVIDSILGWISKLVDKIVNGAVSMIRKFVGWLNKIPGVNIKLPEPAKDITGDVKNQLAGNKSTNLVQNNQFDINAPMGANGETGLTPSGVGAAVNQAARSVFNMELKKILIASL